MGIAIEGKTAGVPPAAGETSAVQNENKPLPIAKVSPRGRGTRAWTQTGRTSMRIASILHYVTYLDLVVNMQLRRRAPRLLITRAWPAGEASYPRAAERLVLRGAQGAM